MRSIVFIHIPRTGGGTFKNILTSWYLPENCHRINCDHEAILAGIRKGNLNPFRQHNRVMHGHFAYHPSYKKYFLCTFLRNPVDWVVSRWAYHKMHKRPLYTGSVIDFMDWGFVNMQSKYLKGSTLDDFNFVGITDRYVDSMKMFKRLAPLSKVEKWININDWEEEMIWQKKVFDGNFKNASRPIYVTAEEKQIIQERNQEDFELYKRALERLLKFINNTDFL